MRGILCISDAHLTHLAKIFLHKLAAHHADERGCGVVSNSLGKHGLACVG
jgi:hypothetical protein